MHLEHGFPVLSGDFHGSIETPNLEPRFGDWDGNPGREICPR